MSSLPRIAAVLAALAAVVSIGGCGGNSSKASSTGLDLDELSPSSVPKPDLARIVPQNYVVKKIWYGNLGGKVPDAVVSSKGPGVGGLGLHPAELQVLSWDSLAKRWNVVFDAQKTKVEQQQFGTPTSNEYVTSTPQAPPSAPILDPGAEGSVEQVAFVRFGGEKNPDLVFSTSQTYGGSGVPGSIVIVGLQGGEANVRYLWYGDGGAGFRVVGTGAAQTLAASAGFWTQVDAHCCPVRTYSFTIGAVGQGIDSVRDDRPWLGLLAKAEHAMQPNSAIDVVGIVPGSPADGRFQKGDVITGLAGAKTSKNLGLLGPALIDQFALLKAGDSATFDVQRNGSPTTVTVELGSLIDSSAQQASPPSDISVMAI